MQRMDLRTLRADGTLRHRDRRGRGARGPLAWPPVPAMTTRRTAFDDLVLDVVERLEPTLARHRVEVDFATENVPPDDPAPWEHRAVALGRTYPERGSQPPRVVVYRRPIETRADTPGDLVDLITEVIVEQVATLIGVSPEDLLG